MVSKGFPETASPLRVRTLTDPSEPRVCHVVPLGAPTPEAAQVLVHAVARFLVEAWRDARPPDRAPERGNPPSTSIAHSAVPRSTA